MTTSGCEADGGFGCESGGGGGGGDDGGGGGDGVGEWSGVKRVMGLCGRLWSEEIPASDGDVGGSFWASASIFSVTKWMSPITLPPSSILVNVVVSWA